MKIFLRKIVLLWMVLALFGIAGCGKQELLPVESQKVSLEDSVSASFEGYNGYAIATEVFDVDSLNALVETEKVQTYITKLSKDILSEEERNAMGFSDLLSYKVEGDENGLSNGDTVTVTVEASKFLKENGETLESMQEELGIKIENKKIEVPVEGLEDAKVFDFIDLIDDYIVYSGADGCGRASFDLPSIFYTEKDGFCVYSMDNSYSGVEFNILYDKTFLATVSVGCEGNGLLSEGDSYILEVAGDNLTLGDTGYVINSKKKIIVPKLGDYVTSKDELTDALKKEFEEMLAIDLKKNGETVLDYYWGTAIKKTVAGDLRTKYAVLFTTTYESWSSGTCYKIYVAEDMIKNLDGTYDISFLSFPELENLDELDTLGYDLETLEW